MIQLHCEGTSARAKVDGPITEGAVGLRVELRYDSAWDGLTKVFSCMTAQERRDVLDVENETILPYETLKAGLRLWIGVTGLEDNGDIRIPTVWADCGKVQPSANWDGGACKPTPEEMEQLLTTAANARRTAQRAEDTADDAEEIALEARNTAEEAREAAITALDSAKANAAAAEVSAALAEQQAGNAASSATTAALASANATAAAAGAENHRNAAGIEAVRAEQMAGEAYGHAATAKAYSGRAEQESIAAQNASTQAARARDMALSAQAQTQKLYADTVSERQQAEAAAAEADQSAGQAAAYAEQAAESAAIFDGIPQQMERLSENMEPYGQNLFGFADTRNRVLPCGLSVEFPDRSTVMISGCLDAPARNVRLPINPLPEGRYTRKITVTQGELGSIAFFFQKPGEDPAGWPNNSAADLPAGTQIWLSILDGYAGEFDKTYQCQIEAGTEIHDYTPGGETTAIDRVARDDLKTVGQELGGTKRSLDALWKISKGQLWDIEQAECEGHAQLPIGGEYGNVDEVRGKTEQETTQGYNVLPPTLIPSRTHGGITFTNNNDGTIRCVGTSLNYDGVTAEISLPLGSYIPAVTEKGAGIQLIARRVFADGTRKDYSSDRSEVFVIDGSEASMNVKLQVVTGATVDLNVTPYIVNGSSVQDFETYTGGIPSPNPDYPQEIKSIERIRVLYTNADGDTLDERTITPPRPLNAIGEYRDKCDVVEGVWVYNTQADHLNRASGINPNVYQFFTLSNRNYAKERFAFASNRYRNIGDSSDRGYNAYINTSMGVIVCYDHRFATLSEADGWNADNPIDVIYAVEKNTEPIDPADLEWLRSLTLLPGENLTITDNWGRDVSYLMSDIINLGKVGG